jgi:integrase
MTDGPNPSGRKERKVRGFFQRNGVWYIRFYYRRREYKFSAWTRSKKGAAEELAKARANKAAYLAERQQERERAKNKFRAWVDEYLTRMERAGKRDMQRRRLALDHLLEEFGNRTLDDLTRADVEAYRDRRAKVVSPASVNRELAHLSHLYTVAVQEGMTTTNPARAAGGVKRMKEPPGRDRFLQPEEAQAYFDEAPIWLARLAEAAAQSGCREGELCNLQWPEVDFRSGFIRILYSKNGESRMVPMSRRVREILSGIVRRVDQPYVFTGAKGGPLVRGWTLPENRGLDGRPKPGLEADRWRIGRAHRPTLKRACLSNFRFHDWRHHFGSWLAMGGIDIERRMAIMGHKTVEMARRYSHLEPDYIKAAVAVIDEFSLSKSVSRTGTED